MKVWLAVIGDKTTPFLEKELAEEYIRNELKWKYEHESPWYEPLKDEMVEVVELPIWLTGFWR